MSYFELLKLASPEAIVVVTALAVLAGGLTKLNPAICSLLAAVGLAIAAAAVLKLPAHANLLGGMLVVSPLNSLFKIVCLALAFLTVPQSGRVPCHALAWNGRSNASCRR